MVTMSMSMIPRLQLPLLLVSLALLSPPSPAQGKGGFKCSAGISTNICLVGFSYHWLNCVLNFDLYFIVNIYVDCSVSLGGQKLLLGFF